MNFVNKKIIAVFFLILALTFTGCGKSEEKQAEDILKIAYTTDPQGLDPHRTAAVSTFNVTGSIYETLLAITPDWEVQPRLAESYEISPDGMEITFKLREGVLFHNGREMKAEDVKNSFERLKGEESPKAKDYANINEINVYEIDLADENKTAD
jgi:peptide/nickel transport system substrate-binding protein